jgi:uncharacterized protein YukE
MVTRINLSQLKNKLRQIESQQRQAVNRYNQQVRQHNQRVTQHVRNLNTAINKYNQEVRAYNDRLRSNRQRLRNEIARLQSQSSTRYVHYRESVIRVSAAFERLDHRLINTAPTPQENFFADLSEREAANTIGLFNALTSEDRDTELAELIEAEEVQEFQKTAIVDEIAVVSEELDNRWRGALFALHPRNPEAARHFCASVREIFTAVLELKAPDGSVFQATPGCARTPVGNATRRSKIDYLLSLKGIRNPELTEFANEDIDNVIELFEVLNGATHGASGRLSIPTLRQVKKRVEDGLFFLCRLAA